MKIYLATSWKNPYYPRVLQELRSLGHEVYDFRDPEYAFKWDQVGLSEQRPLPLSEYIRGLEHPRARKGFKRDMDAVRWCDAVVVLLPSGRSAHMEFAWCIGAGKPGVIFCPQTSIGALAEVPAIDDPDLMYCMAGEPRDIFVHTALQAHERLTWALLSKEGTEAHESLRTRPGVD